MKVVGHLPKRSIEDILRQRQRVMRGREETWWERSSARRWWFRIDWEGVALMVMMLSSTAMMAGLAVVLWRSIL